MKFARLALALMLSISFFNQTFAAPQKTPVTPPSTLAVTPSGVALGFTLTPIITGIPVVNNGWGIDGAVSAVAAKNGDIVVTSFNDDVVRVYSNSDTANGSRLKSTTTIVGIHYAQLANLNGAIYARVNQSTSTPTSGSLVQLNDNGTLARTVASNIPSGFPLVAAPCLNSLFFGSNSAGGFYVITAPNGGAPYNSLNPSPAFYQISTDPIGGTFNMYFDCCSKSVYAEYASNLGRFSLAGMTLTQNLGLYIEGGPYDGSAYGIGKIGGTSTLYGNFIINNRHDAIILDPETNVRTTILSGGNYDGHAVSPYPDGSLLLTSGNTVYKLRCTNCSFL